MKFGLYLKTVSVTWLTILFVFSIDVSSKNLPLLEFNSIVLPEVAENGMIVSQEARATSVGVAILEAGGNAIDAAVAVGFALAVTLPRAGNIGGGGFMLIYDKKSGKVNALDYREKAPINSNSNMFLDENLSVDRNKSRYSVFASGVPGTVKGLIAAHNRYGRLPLRQVIQPAIQLANKLPVSYAMAQSLNAKKKFLSVDKESRRIFTKGKKKFWKKGDVIRQADLAKTLQLIANTNGEDFYTGKTARKITQFFAKRGGLVGQSDLKNYHVVWRKPISTTYAKSDDVFSIYSMPPPSSGGVHLVQLLNIVSHFSLEQAGPNTAYSTHVKAEAMKYVYADRSRYLGDPDFTNIPVNRLTSLDYAKKIAKAINLKQTTASNKIKPGQYIDDESPQTTHFSVIDKAGNMVSNTYTLNFSFGSGITVPGTGMLLNNEMDDFSAKPGAPNSYGLLGGQANAIQPNKRPLSSMTPVIALHNNKPWIATGSPGGSRIISIVFNFLLNRIVHNMNIAEATIMPRMHHQWYPDRLLVEKGFPLDTISLLKSKGHNLVPRAPWGSLQSIEYSDDVYYGFSDPRRPGAMAKGVDRLP